MRERARDQGKPAGGGRPFGYRWVTELVQEKGKTKKVSHLEIVPAEKVVVERIYRDYCKGGSLGALARQLQEDGIPAVKGPMWSSSTLGNILSSPLYIGKIKQKGEVFQGSHEPIIDEELWNDVARRRTGLGRKRGGRKPRGAHLLTGGLLKCRCGHSMIPRTEHDGRYQVYACEKRVPCDQTPLSRKLVDTSVLAELTDHYVDLDETRRQIETKLAADLTIAREALAHAERESATAEATLARVRNHYQQERITAEDWSQQRPGLVAGVEAAQEALQRAREHVEEVEATGVPEDAQQTLLRHMEALRAAVTNGVGQAPDLNALRLVMHDLFDSFELIQWPSAGTGKGGYVVEHNPVVEHEGVTLALLPRLRWESVDGSLAIRKTVLPLGGKNHPQRNTYTPAAWTSRSGRPWATTT
jgi:Recombinase